MFYRADSVLKSFIEILLESLRIFRICAWAHCSRDIACAWRTQIDYWRRSHWSQRFSPDQLPWELHRAARNHTSRLPPYGKRAYPLHIDNRLWQENEYIIRNVSQVHAKLTFYSLRQARVAAIASGLYLKVVEYGVFALIQAMKIERSISSKWVSELLGSTHLGSGHWSQTGHSLSGGRCP